MTSLLAVSALTALAGCSSTEDSGSTDEAAATALPSKHAIVLAHGFDASKDQANRWSFYKVEQDLKDAGYVVVGAQVSPYQPVPVRAQELVTYVEQAMDACAAREGCDASKVHIIAHSMGGLDSRYVISKLTCKGAPCGDHVASLTTISTPHHGSAIADKLVSALGLATPSELSLVNDLASKWGLTFTDPKLAAADVKGALFSISEQGVKAFNQDVKPYPGVVYKAYAGLSYVGSKVIDAPLQNPRDPDGKVACEGKFVLPATQHDIMDTSLVAAAAFVAHGTALDPNDGMVTVESAKLPSGHGEFMGCIPADHLDEVGHSTIAGVGVGPGVQNHDGPTQAGFDHRKFYLDIASKLDGWVAAHGNSK